MNQFWWLEVKSSVTASYVGPQRGHISHISEEAGTMCYGGKQVGNSWKGRIGNELTDIQDGIAELKLNSLLCYDGVKSQ